MASTENSAELVITALDRYLAMQAEHLSGLNSGCLNKINLWIEERQHIVGRMRQALAEAQSSGVTPETRDIILAKLGAIIEREKALSAATEQQRSSLGEKISSLRRGKKAINGYSQTLSPSPLFVNHKR